MERHLFLIAHHSTPRRCLRCFSFSSSAFHSFSAPLLTSRFPRVASTLPPRRIGAKMIFLPLCTAQLRARPGLYSNYWSGPSRGITVKHCSNLSRNLTPVDIRAACSLQKYRQDEETIITPAARLPHCKHSIKYLEPRNVIITQCGYL